MKSNKAFTLIELLVVVLIIGILAAIAVPQYQLAVAKARLSEVMLLVKEIKNQQEMFYLQNGRYATNCAELNVDLPAGVIPVDDGKYFALQKGSYYVFYHCSNEGNRTSVSIRDEITSSDSSFLVSIETFFDNISNESRRGRSYCYTRYEGLGRKLCNNVINEKGGNYWL